MKRWEPSGIGEVIELALPGAQRVRGVFVMPSRRSGDKSATAAGVNSRMRLRRYIHHVVHMICGQLHARRDAVQWC